jgi:hypothetical protein
MPVKIVVFAGALALTLSCSEASAQQQFNGTWNVEVTPQRGICSSVVRFPVLIQNGQVRHGGAETMGVSGAVTPGGVIQGNVGVGPVRAIVVGHLSGRTGAGTWAASGRLGCSGRWQAAKLV